MCEYAYPLNLKLCMYGKAGRDLFCKKLYPLPSTKNQKIKMKKKKLLLGLKVIKAFLLALALCNIRVSNQVMQIIIFFYLEYASVIKNVSHLIL